MMAVNCQRLGQSVVIQRSVTLHTIGSWQILIPAIALISLQLVVKHLYLCNLRDMHYSITARYAVFALLSTYIRTSYICWAVCTYVQLNWSWQGKLSLPFCILTTLGALHSTPVNGSLGWSEFWTIVLLCYVVVQIQGLPAWSFS